MFVLPMTIISICYTHIICLVRTAVQRARKTNAMPIRKFNLIRDQGKLFVEYKFIFFFDQVQYILNIDFPIQKTSAYFDI